MMLLRLIIYTLVVSFYTVFINAAIDQSNFIAPTAASPYRLQSNGIAKQRAILPYSLYQRKLEEQNRLKAQQQQVASKPKLTSTATNQYGKEPKLEDESNKPLYFYLPAFKNANESQIAEEDTDAGQSRKAMLQRLNGTTVNTNDDNAEVVSPNYDSSSQEKSAYSTSNSRQPLPYHKSIFRPKTNQIVTINEPRYQSNQSGQNSIIKYNPKPMSEKLIESNVPERPATSQISSLRKNMFINGVPLESSANNFNQIVQPAQANGSPILVDPPYQPRPVYSNLGPSPYNTLSSEPSSQNIIESIFSQSQTPVRFSPASAQQIAGLAQPAAQQPLNPLQALGNTVNSLGGQDMLSQLLGGGGSPLEQISKLARNLLNLPGNNPELLATLTKSLATNTVAEGSKLTSNAVVQPVPALSNAIASGLDKTAGLAANAGAETLFSSAKDEETSNATIKMLNNLPEDQRTLLAAAIENGEIDSTKLSPTLSSLVKDKSILKSENRLLEWIQQNRPRVAERETKEGTSGALTDKLPYYGRYCGSFVEQTNASRHYNIAGALWAVDEHRLIVSKFHFKPGSRTENITFWIGPLNETGTPADVFPNDNGFYVQPKPVDLNVFLNQKVEVITAKIRPQNHQKDDQKAAELEEMEEDQNKNLSKNELRRLKRDSKTVGSIPLHFEASKNDTDKSVNLTITSQNSDATTSGPSDNDQSHILVSSTNNEANISNETTTKPSSTASPSSLVPLDWYAGFQPLLLTLPDRHSVRTIHWVSVYDHKKKESAAVVLIPNGIAFQIPSLVQLRPLTPNGAYKVSSGAIKIMDTKTIELEDFSLETNGLPVWFMVGKEILPHAGGEIVPVLNKANNEFDCDSLRDYKNETVTLRLPGTLDTKDVFWLSVFSIPKSVSLSHLYIPYNDLHVPTDLLGISTPRCVWKPEKV